MAQIVLPNGFIPRSYQASAMAHFDRTPRNARGVYVWPRRAGKDLTFVHQAIKMAMKQVGIYYHMLPTNKQARKVVWDGIDNDGRRIIDTAIPECLRASVNQAEMKIVLKNGSLWQCVGSDYYDMLVGTNPRGLVLSEFALTDPRAWGYFRPILRANGGWAAFISTPRGYNQLNDLLDIAKAEVRRGNTNWDFSHWDAITLGLMTQADIDEEIRQGMRPELARQEFLCDFDANNVGSILGDLYTQAQREGRIVQSLEYNPEYGPVHASMDLGFRDTASFWAYQEAPDGLINYFHYDHASGLDADDWISLIEDKPFPIEYLWLPHDARARTFRTRSTVQQAFMSSGVANRVGIVPKTSIVDRVNSARAAMKKSRFGEDQCSAGLAGLRSWGYKYNEETRMFSSEPDHNWASHPGDAYSYGGQMLWKDQPMEVRPQPVYKTVHEMTLDELFEDHHTFKSGRIS